MFILMFNSAHFTLNPVLNWINIYMNYLLLINNINVRWTSNTLLQFVSYIALQIMLIYVFFIQSSVSCCITENSLN